MKKILIALDNEDSARQIAEIGHGLATPETDNVFEANRIEENILNQCKAHLGDDSIQTIIEVGDCCENILSTASDLKDEMIVMGTHNRSGNEKIFAGSVAEKVLHHSKIPVLIIPK